MNIGQRNRPIYVCDRCKNRIEGYHKNSTKYQQPNKYFKIKKGEYMPTKDFDLCESCENEFREWLKTKPVKNVFKQMIDDFPKYEKGDINERER